MNGPLGQYRTKGRWVGQKLDRKTGRHLWIDPYLDYFLCVFDKDIWLIIYVRKDTYMVFAFLHCFPWNRTETQV